MGLSHSSYEISGTQGTLLASNTKRGWKGRAESSQIRLGKRTSLFIHLVLHPNPTNKLVRTHSTHLLGTSHGRPWTHLTHHGPDSEEATTFPHIVFFAALRRTCIHMALFPGTPKVESRNYPGLDFRDFGCS